MRRILAIRPDPGLAATIGAGRGAGLEIEGWPLFRIAARGWKAPSRDEIDGLLLGSANALRHGGPQLDGFRDKPVFAVGGATADAARAFGFRVEATGMGELQKLLDVMAGQSLRLLRLTGAAHVPVTPPPGISIHTVVGYESLALPMPDALKRALREGALVLVHSAVAMRHLAEQCGEHDIALEQIAIAALSPRIANAAGGGWQRVEAAASPDEAALLALAQDMCH